MTVFEGRRALSDGESASPSPEPQLRALAHGLALLIDQAREHGPGLDLGQLRGLHGSLEQTLSGIHSLEREQQARMLGALGLTREHSQELQQALQLRQEHRIQALGLGVIGEEIARQEHNLSVAQLRSATDDQNYY